jgi:hypothetical protein
MSHIGSNVCRVPPTVGRGSPLPALRSLGLLGEDPRQLEQLRSGPCASSSCVSSRGPRSVCGLTAAIRGGFVPTALLDSDFPPRAGSEFRGGGLEVCCARLGGAVLPDSLPRTRPTRMRPPAECQAHKVVGWNSPATQAAAFSRAVRSSGMSICGKCVQCRVRRIQPGLLFSRSYSGVNTEG